MGDPAEDHPGKIKLVDFLEKKTLAGRVWKKVGQGIGIFIPRTVLQWT